MDAECDGAPLVAELEERLFEFTDDSLFLPELLRQMRHLGRSHHGSAAIL